MGPELACQWRCIHRQPGCGDAGAKWKKGDSRLYKESTPISADPFTIPCISRSKVQGPRGGGALLEKGGCAGGRLCFNFLGGRACSDWRRRRRPARQIRKFWLPSFAEFFPVDALFPSFPAHFLCVRGMVRQRGLSTRQTHPSHRSRLLALADRRETEHGEANAR